VKHMLIEFGPAKTYCGLAGGRGVIVSAVHQVTCLNCLRVIHAHAANCIDRERARRPQLTLIKKTKRGEQASLLT
jgi:hypothetical protein